VQQAPAFSLEQDGLSRHHHTFIGATAGVLMHKEGALLVTCFNIDFSKHAASLALGMHKISLQGWDSDLILHLLMHSGH
jgi:hypothetical protein